MQPALHLRGADRRYVVTCNYQARSGEQTGLSAHYQQFDNPDSTALDIIAMYRRNKGDSVLTENVAHSDDAAFVSFEPDLGAQLNYVSGDAVVTYLLVGPTAERDATKLARLPRRAPRF
jgi:hypothetical protein